MASDAGSRRDRRHAGTRRTSDAGQGRHRSSRPRAASAARRSPSTSPWPPPSSSQAGRARRRQLPVRRRRGAAQPEPQEQVHRRRGRASWPAATSTTLDSHAGRPQHRRSRAAGAAQPRDGRAGHARPRSAIVSALRMTHDLVVVDCLAAAARHDPRLPRPVRPDRGAADARDHQHQEHAPVPRAGPTSSATPTTRSSWCSTAPIRPTASACRTSSSSIGRKIDHTVVSDGRTVVYALNRGVPFVVRQQAGPGQPGRRAAWPRRSPAERRADEPR